jgi:hypothetical protein
MLYIIREPLPKKHGNANTHHESGKEARFGSASLTIPAFQKLRQVQRFKASLGSTAIPSLERPKKKEGKDVLVCPKQ